MENKKLENFIKLLKQNKLMVVLMLSTLFMFASTFWYPLIYVATLVLCVGIITLKFNDIICVLVYCSMFARFLVPFIATTIVAFVVILIRYIIDIKSKNVEFLKLPFVVTTVICLLYSLIHYEVNDLGLYQGVMIIAFLYMIYFVISYRKQLEIKKYFDYLFFGLVISAALSAVIYIIPGLETVVFDGDLGYIMTPLKDNIAHIDGDFVRISLLSFHVNHLAAFCLFAMAYSSIVLLTKTNKLKIDIVYYVFMYLANLIVGLLTLSKAFIVVFAFEIFVTIIYFVAKYKKKALKIIGIAFVVVVLLALVLRDQFVDIFERFFVYNYDTILGMLTTGRSGIWQQYANAVLESPLKLLFGFGLFSQEQLLIGPHNFYIFILYRFGLIGIMMIAYLIYSYIKSINSKVVFSLRNSLIFLTFLVIGLQEACVDERFYFFIIGLMFMFTKTKNVEKDNDLIEKNK